LDTGALEITPGGVEYRAEVADVGVPKTLRGLVGARLARVGVADRQLLQIASVAGPRFSVDLLARVTAEEAAAVLGSLTVLEGRGLIVRAGMSDFSFAHELFGEVVREGLTLEARRAIHGAVAAALEALYPQRLDELAERLAAHWREAGDRVRSVDCLVRAGERLASEFATESASRMFEKAIEVHAQLPVPDRDRMLALYRRVGEICWKGRALEHGASRMLRAVELAEGLEQDGWVARFALLRGRLLVAAHRVEEGRKWLARAEGIALRLADSVLERDITLARAEGSMRLGQHRDAIAAFEHARALSVRLSDTDAQVRCLVPLALAYASLGDRAIALDGLTDARRLAGERLDPFTECELLKMESLVHYFSRDYEATVDTATRARDLAKEYGLVHEAAVNAHNIGDALVRLGDSKRAFASLRYSFELSRDHGFDSLMMSNLRILGFIDAMRFGSDEGRRHVVQANEFDAAKGYVWHLLQGRYYLAMIDQARGMTEDSRTGLRELLRMAAEHGHAR
ncbi:MAG: hypothetical protein NTZ61_00185, partial [Proteobacteria bacterium]|nr:hypothetical protein [Pseudomonadota bacterium]